MKRIRIVGLCLVAAFTFSAVAAVSASAEPEYLTKAVVTSGSHIQQAGTLKASFLEGVNKSKISCTGGTSTGEITGPRSSANNVTKFTNCETQGVPCENAGAGEIVTNKLAGVLGKVSATLPGLKLFSESEGKGGKLAKFTCAGGLVEIVVKGQVTGSLSGSAGTGPDNGKLVPSVSLSFAQAKGIQKYLGFIEGPEAGEKGQEESSVNGGPFEKGGQSVVAKLSTVPSTLEVGITKS